ncbi:GHKL domain-containing protein [Desulfurispirillum indicum]|uniref:histidine kinase n=1 Tax=Desulfurispirillum indicum (strain ATCC BAA-1389 / DSM 22839 / S5) TaxID=653733 RepID=E6W6F8_DESIS|nr:ATP-binding protein [Desulfurispirillum indicum]ADU67293.1 ATP-binding region ATPase domain protein [Desulfurispirillum indicum S5]UCZ56665.1 GHKL domain-containing protein [Desulfurispirillum indicum]
MSSFARVFLIIAIPMALAILPLVYIANGIVMDGARKNLMEEMKTKWAIMAALEIPQEYNREFHDRLRAMARTTSLRITLIHTDGSVTYDSHVAAAQMEQIANHSQRPEVLDALELGESYFTRISTTIHKEMVYYAKPLEDGRILRISYPTTYITRLEQDARERSLIFLLMLLAATALVSAYLARKISLPIQRLSYIAEAVESGRSSIHFPHFRDPTMAKISHLIARIYHAMIAKQERLREEQEKLENIFGILEEGIILVDRDNTILHSNPKSQEFLGVEFHVGSNLLGDIQDFQVISFLREILESEENNLWDKRRFRDRVYEVNLRVLAKEKLIAFFDVTEEDKYERYKTELVGNISHELRTPITMIMGYAETLLSDPDLPTERRERFLRIIYKSSHSLSALIEDVLQLNRLEQTGQEFAIDEPLLMEDVILTLRERFATITSKVIHYDVPGGMQVWCTYEHVLSILSNLIDNAMKYSSGSTIHVRVHQKPPHLVLEVEDEGPAIPAKERERIFERFYTVSQSRNRAKSGTGVGLSIVKHIVHAYGGRVDISESRQHGNIFTVRLVEKREKRSEIL